MTQQTKTTIEEINGKLCTVIVKPYSLVKHLSLLEIGESLRVRYFEGRLEQTKRGIYTHTERVVSSLRQLENIGEDGGVLEVVTRLPALPRNPKPEDARLLYRYMAEGIDLRFEISESELTCEGGLSFGSVINHIDCCTIEVTHAICPETGNKLEVAIND